MKLSHRGPVTAFLARGGAGNHQARNFCADAAVFQLLSKLAVHVTEGSITVVLDNARYQKCALVQCYAAALEIELLYLPSFSPHLNLIERLWRFVRKECLYSHYYATFPEFRAALETCLTTAHRERRIELETLLAWNFQSFHDVQTLPA